MKLPEFNYFNIGPRLTVIFSLLIALILGGNSLLVWQFRAAREQTERLTDVSQQLIAVLRLQENLMAFHQRLDELAETRDAQRLVAEAVTLRTNLLEQTQRTRTVLARMPVEARVDPAFQPTLEAIEITLPSQLDAIEALATSGDWDAVRRRVSNELKPLERQTSALVNNIDQEVSGQLAQALVNMGIAQRRIFLIVPLTAICTFLIAAFFGWSITQRMGELRLEERLNERMRIARELHDTLLQGFIGARMQLDIVADQMPADSPSKGRLARVQQIMAQVIEEGRNAVRDFRSSESEMEDLEQALSRIPQDLGLKQGIDFRLIVEGQAQSLHPAIQHEVYSIGREALVNSFRHSGASRIEVELEYSAKQLRMLARDDGCGIDAEVLEIGRHGHWGLSGMRERAERIGAKLKILSRAGGGTEVELCVPGNVAFRGTRIEPFIFTHEPTKN
jgi:signal transduction histidine kinase